MCLKIKCQTATKKKAEKPENRQQRERMFVIKKKYTSANSNLLILYKLDLTEKSKQQITTKRPAIGENNKTQLQFIDNVSDHKRTWQ